MSMIEIPSPQSATQPMIVQSVFVATVALCAGLFAAPALAIDGEILINQARVNAGGITPGDTPGFPATLSRPGRYKLTGNLAVPAGQTGIQITQHEVTVDLNGFTISSVPPEQALTAIDAPDMNGIRVINGTITGFRNYAVNYDSGWFGVVANMRIVFTGTGAGFQIGVGGGNQSRIHDNTIANGRIGIFACGRCFIAQNVVSGHTDYGIWVGGGLVLGNVIVGSDFEGLFARADWVGYGSNILFGNAGGGAQVYGPALQLHPNVCQPGCP